MTEVNVGPSAGNETDWMSFLLDDAPVSSEFELDKLEEGLGDQDRNIFGGLTGPADQASPGPGSSGGFPDARAAQPQAGVSEGSAEGDAGVSRCSTPVPSSQELPPQPVTSSDEGSAGTTVDGGHDHGAQEAHNKKGGGADDDKKREARLVRNRENAHLSRQRKKQHQEEMERRCRNLETSNSELQSIVARLVTENHALRQQLDMVCKQGGRYPAGVHVPPPLPPGIIAPHLGTPPKLPLPPLKSFRKIPAPGPQRAPAPHGAHLAPVAGHVGPSSPPPAAAQADGPAAAAAAAAGAKRAATAAAGGGGAKRVRGAGAALLSVFMFVMVAVPFGPSGGPVSSSLAPGWSVPPAHHRGGRALLSLATNESAVEAATRLVKEGLEADNQTGALREVRLGVPAPLDPAAVAPRQRVRGRAVHAPGVGGGGNATTAPRGGGGGRGARAAVAGGAARAAGAPRALPARASDLQRLRDMAIEATAIEPISPHTSSPLFLPERDTPSPSPSPASSDEPPPVGAGAGGGGGRRALPWVEGGALPFSLSPVVCSEVFQFAADSVADPHKASLVQQALQRQRRVEVSPRIAARRQAPALGSRVTPQRDVGDAIPLPPSNGPFAGARDSREEDEEYVPSSSSSSSSSSSEGGMYESGAGSGGGGYGADGGGGAGGGPGGGNGGLPESGVVVSLLMPEGPHGSKGGGGSGPGDLSQIFVVVFVRSAVEGAKYVTYSCSTGLAGAFSSWK